MSARDGFGLAGATATVALQRQQPKKSRPPAFAGGPRGWVRGICSGVCEAGLRDQARCLLREK